MKCLGVEPASAASETGIHFVEHQNLPNSCSAVTEGFEVLVGHIAQQTDFAFARISFCDERVISSLV